MRPRRHPGLTGGSVLLTVGSARETESSVLAVIDARTMTLLARASVPSAIPLGFHGSFVH